MVVEVKIYAGCFDEAVKAYPRSHVKVWNPGLDGSEPRATSGFMPHDCDGSIIYVERSYISFHKYCGECGSAQYKRVWF